jgi:hypothetical protein
MAKFKILYWHGIPSQVRSTDKNGRVGKQLPERFQLAIDDVAKRAKFIRSASFTDGFQWTDEEERSGSAEEVALAVVAELDIKYQKIYCQRITESLKEYN